MTFFVCFFVVADHEVAKRSGGEWPFTGPGGRRRCDKRSFWRLCEVERSDENVV
jgi:hypothetical protein